ncbi:hypothetical protein BK668_18830 [Pseudomonas fluorescens]|nr:hypothetical protein BK668_18830 [Pseudomonas fluorescens]
MLLERFGQLYECLCLDSHCCHLVRFSAFIILDQGDNWLIQFFYLIDMQITQTRYCHFDLNGALQQFLIAVAGWLD